MDIFLKIDAQHCSRIRSGLLCLSLLLLSHSLSASIRSGPGRDSQWVAAWSGLGSLVSDMPDYSNISAGWGWNVRVGSRLQRRVSAHQMTAGIFVETGRSRWLMAETDLKMMDGVWSTGLGTELLLLKERIRVAVAVGIAVLMSDIAFHRMGDRGGYVDIHPLSLRKTMGRRKLVFEVSPLTCTWFSSGREKLDFRRLEYRTVFTLEVPF
jgi:hypothetical protein